MHHQGVGLQSLGTRLGEPVAGGVLAHGREQRLLLALELHAQEHHDVDLGDHVVEIVAHPHRPAFERLGQQRGRRDQRDLGAEQVQRLDVAAGDPGVAHVADDGDAQPGQLPVAAQGEHVEQRLGGMRVAAVAGVDHRRVDPVDDAVGRTGRGVAHDDGVDAHGRDGLHGVAQALALLHRRLRHAEGHDVAGQALGRGLEAEAGAGGVLVEERGDDLAPEGGDLGDVALVHRQELLREVEQPGEALDVEVVDRQQVLHPIPSPTPSSWASHSSMPSSPPSTSARRTRTSSVRPVGRFLPT